jgi:hypothetical protein
MRRVAVLGILALTPMLLASGCGLFSSHDVRIEVAGNGRADEIFYSFPGQVTKQDGNVTNAPSVVRNVDLPWSVSAQTGFGFVDVTTRAGNPITCRIIVDGREVLNRHGSAANGFPCHYSVQDS